MTSPSQLAAFFKAAPVPTETKWTTIFVSVLIMEEYTHKNQNYKLM